MQQVGDSHWQHPQSQRQLVLQENGKKRTKISSEIKTGHRTKCDAPFSFILK